MFACCKQTEVATRLVASFKVCRSKTHVSGARFFFIICLKRFFLDTKKFGGSQTRILVIVRNERRRLSGNVQADFR